VIEFENEAENKKCIAVFGLTCAKYQSGEVDWSDKISRCGDERIRAMLYETAQSMIRSKKWLWLKVWAMQIAWRRGTSRAYPNSNLGPAN
jgi:transposase